MLNDFFMFKWKKKNNPVLSITFQSDVCVCVSLKFKYLQRFPAHSDFQKQRKEFDQNNVSSLGELDLDFQIAHVLS